MYCYALVALGLLLSASDALPWNGASQPRVRGRALRAQRLPASPLARQAPEPAHPSATQALQLPPDAAAGNVTAPTGALRYVAIGGGTQNYTCSGNGEWVSAGAVAQLYDISNACTPAAEVASSAFGSSEYSKLYPLLGHHYFVRLDALLPKFDFTQTLHSDTAFVVASKAGSIPSPADPRVDVPWLKLRGVAGDLASTVYRTDTHGGQPPAGTALCKEGQTLEVPYVAVYWFYA